jgi:DNA-binding LytR/AlgR family response regulator
MAQHTALIAEDEAVLRDELRSHLASLWPELKVVAEARDGLEALQMLDQHAPDLIFLDIQMPGLSGLEVARQVAGRCHVVFVTAYDAHAVAAFEEGAVDYLLKPYSLDRLQVAVNRVRERIGGTTVRLDGLLAELARVVPQRNFLRWINAGQGDEMRLITVDEVLYFESDTKYTRVVVPGKDALIRTSLKELQDQLDPSHFWMIHRSVIVNANAIEGVTRDFRGRLFVKLKSRDERLAVSNSQAHRFRQM